MKKVLICGVIAAAFGMSSAFAAGIGGTGSATFDVKASLDATCLADNPTTPVVNFGAIAAFGAPANAAPTAVVAFKCTKGLVPTASLTTSSGTLVGVSYSLSVTNPGTKTAGTATTGDSFGFTVTGSMTGNEAGDLSDPGTKTHTLTIAF
jgi:hypothetical protein